MARRRPCAPRRPSRPAAGPRLRRTGRAVFACPAGNMIPAEARKSAVFGPASGTVAGMATRTSSAPRGNSSGKSGSSAARGSGPAASKTSRAARNHRHRAHPPAGRRRTHDSPGWSRVVAGAWLGVAHVVGGGHPPDRLRRQRPRPRGPPRRRRPVQPRARRLRRHLRLVGVPGLVPGHRSTGSSTAPSAGCPCCCRSCCSSAPSGCSASPSTAAATTGSASAS